MSRDQKLLYAAAFLRAVGVGLLGVLFALSLASGGFHAGQIGALVAVGVAGSAVGTFLVSFFADQWGRRKTLLSLAACTTAGGVGLAWFGQFPLLALFCFFGMVNAMGRERGALFTLEQAILPETTSAHERTHTLAWYNVILDAGQAIGSLLAGLPFFFREGFGIGERPSYQWTFALYAALGLLLFFLYLGLSPRVEIHGPTPWHKVSPGSRRILSRLCLLFGLDSLAGGFLPASLIAYWFFRRFGITEEFLGPLFFFTHVANACSYVGAAWIARRIGLIRTMVFTHLPSNLCLLALPFAPALGWAVFLYVIRECLVEMDVPTRQSYVMAMVEPSERTLAAGVTNLTRLTAWVVGPGIAGLAMKGLSLNLPLLVGGGLKVFYDLSLYRSFRHLKAPEEK